MEEKGGSRNGASGGMLHGNRQCVRGAGRPALGDWQSGTGSGLLRLPVCVRASGLALAGRSRSLGPVSGKLLMPL